MAHIPCREVTEVYASLPYVAKVGVGREKLIEITVHLQADFC